MTVRAASSLRRVGSRPVGVIEGFYGTPWTVDERVECMQVLAAHGADTYVWAPKSEPRHRDAWDEPFTPGEISGFARLSTCASGVSVSVGLTPGGAATSDAVLAKLAPALEVGCAGVTLCFDDLPVLDAARRHADIANDVVARTGLPTWLVPTHYAGMSGSPYLDTLVGELDERVLVMWTGSHVVTDSITFHDARRRADVTGGRAPLLWDNTPVNDAMMTALLHVGPYHGRDSDLRGELSGLLINPMPAMRASLPTIESACAWWRGDDSVQAWSAAVDRLGLRLLAEATSFPGDPHWPGDAPSREWLGSVAELDVADDVVRPWVEAARRGATIALAAIDALDALDAGEEGAALTRHFLRLLGIGEWMREPVRTLGSGPRTRPVWTQDADGHFAPTAGSIMPTESIPERLLARVNSALARRGADLGE